MKIFRNHSISMVNRTITIFLSFMIVVVILFSTMIYLTDMFGINKINTRYAQDLARLEANVVADWITDQLDLMTSLSSVLQADDTSISKLSSIVDQYPDRFRHFFIVDSDYQYSDTLNVRGNMQKEELVTQIFEGKDFVITDPERHPVYDEELFTIMVPIKSKEQIIAVLGATLKFDELAARLAKFKVNGSGYGWLLDRNLTVITHPLTNHNLKMSLLPKEELKSRNLTDLESSSAFGYKGLENVYSKLNKDITFTESYTDPDGYRRTATFSPINSSVDWYVVLTTFNDKLPNNQFTLLFNMALGLLFTVVACIIVSYQFASNLIKPINTLIHTATLFSEGNKGVRFPEDSQDEMGTLGKAFNSMADTIVEHTENVEELIKERTQMLADLNYQILSRNNELNVMNKELETTNTRLHTLATTDMLTGITNRHELVRSLDSFIADVRIGNEKGFSVLFVDLDNFKYYNDTYGHEIGDFLLIEVTKILKANLREQDILARYGGDEFVIVLKQGDFDVSKMISERIHSKILEKEGFKKEIERRIQTEIQLLGKNKLSCSIGIVNYNKAIEAKNADELLALADDTMYQAKKAGKSRIVVN